MHINHRCNAEAAQSPTQVIRQKENLLNVSLHVYMS